MNWCSEAVVALVREYAARPQLWDPRHALYRSADVKHAAWAELAAAHGCSALEIKKKMNSVLASYRREKGKVRGGHVTQWFLYEHLAFLPSHVDNDADQASDARSEEEDMQAEYLEVPAEEAELVIKQEPAPRPRPASAPRAPRASRAPRAPRALPRPAPDPRFKDECASFGDYIASALRRQPPRTRSVIKHAINNILFEQEMKRFGGAAGGAGAAGARAADPLSDDDAGL